jgi:hypothetical protein
MMTELTEPLDAEMRATRARIAEVQDHLGKIHREHTSDPGAGWAARQQALLIEMGKLQQHLNDVDNARRGFGPARRT